MYKKKIELLPAILEKNYWGVRSRVLKSAPLVDFVQIDICDGEFVPSKTFAASGGKLEARLMWGFSKKVGVELDMMVEIDRDFDKWMDFIKRSGAKRVVFHFGSTEKWDEIFGYFKGLDIEIGLGLQIQHDEEEYFELMEKYGFDYVQFMGIKNIGFGGQALAEEVYDKTASFADKYPKSPVNVDGGVKVDNADKLKGAGVNRLVSGSGFFGAKDLKGRVERFLEV